MLKDILKNILKVNIALNKSMTINAYIHSFVALVNLMRRFTNQKSFHRPATIRFATLFISLSLIHKQKKQFSKGGDFSGMEKPQMVKRSLVGGITSYILQDSCWKNILYALTLRGSLVKVPCIVNGDKKPLMCYIYKALDRAKEPIANSFLNKVENYEEAFRCIDTRWECQLHQSLNAVGHYLNMKIYYSPSVEDCSEVMKGLFDCISRMVLNMETQDKILSELDL